AGPPAQAGGADGRWRGPGAAAPSRVARGAARDARAHGPRRPGGAGAGAGGDGGGLGASHSRGRPGRRGGSFMTLRLILGLGWSLVAGLAGGWLLLAPWALAEQGDGAWTTVT